MSLVSAFFWGGYFWVYPWDTRWEALIPQGYSEGPNHFGVLNILVNLIICESFKESGEMPCVTSAWSSRGQALKTLRTFLNCH